MPAGLSLLLWLSVIALLCQLPPLPVLPLVLALAGWVLAGCAGWLAGCWLAGAVFGSS